MPNPTLYFYAIYQRPTDYPDKFVLRKWIAAPDEIEPRPEAQCQLADSLEAARKLLPKNCFNVGRNEHDVPALVETWFQETDPETDRLIRTVCSFIRG